MIERADNPRAGDTWTDHGTFVCRVLTVSDTHVECEWGATWREKRWSREGFAKFMRYETMPDKTWARINAGVTAPTPRQTPTKP